MNLTIDKGIPLPARTREIWGMALIWLLLALPAYAQTVVDGDTLKLNGTTFRLHGIDAPELHQTCPDGFVAGEYSAAFLRQILEGATVACEPKTIDRYGRTVALCRANGYDISAWMTRQGMAWAFTRYSRDYVDQEALAKAERLGVHAPDCQVPWDYRKDHKR